MAGDIARWIFDRLLGHRPMRMGTHPLEESTWLVQPQALPHSSFVGCRVIVAYDRGSAGRRRLIRRKVGPPRSVEDRMVPPDLWATIHRTRPLVERLEQIRDSNALLLHENWREAINEAIEVMIMRGWNPDD